MILQKKEITKLLFLVSILYIFVLILFLINKYPPKINNCQEISQKEIGKRILISGKIKNQQIYTEREIIYIYSCDIPIILFPKGIIIFPKDKELKIIGDIEVYNNKTQIIAEKISY
jgi:hypothetical protein